jgi:hypothetical protein
MGANWKTTVSSIGAVFFSALTFLSTVSYDQGPIAMVIPMKYKPYVGAIAGVAALILWIYNGVRQKDKDVTGGVVQQTVSGAVAAPGTQTLVDETIKATIKSDEPVTPQQKRAVQ